jgi:hypothetical protein
VVIFIAWYIIKEGEATIYYYIAIFSSRLASIWHTSRIMIIMTTNNNLIINWEEEELAAASSCLAPCCCVIKSLVEQIFVPILSQIFALLLSLFCPYFWLPKISTCECQQLRITSMLPRSWWAIVVSIQDGYIDNHQQINSEPATSQSVNKVVVGKNAASRSVVLIWPVN